MADNSNTKTSGLFGIVTSLFGKKENDSENNEQHDDEPSTKSEGSKSRPNSTGTIQSMSNSFEYNWKQYNQSGKKVPGNAIKQIRGAQYPVSLPTNLGTQSIRYMLLNYYDCARTCTLKKLFEI